MDTIKKNKLNTALLCLCLIIIVTFIWFGINYFFHPIIVQGNSMCPSLTDGDIVLCSSDFSMDDINRGDIVVFRKKYKPYIKRVIALPGETVGINNNGMLTINGEELWTINFEAMEDPGILSDREIILAEDEYFCLGDNRNHSNDSRALGPVNYKEIKCKVTKKLEGGIF